MPKRHVLLGLVILLSLWGCVSPMLHQLPISSLQARSTFGRLALCAKARNLAPSESAETVTVRYDPSVVIEFAIQGEQYNMIVRMDDEVPDEERSARSHSAKITGDALFICSMQSGVIAASAKDAATSSLAATSSEDGGFACTSAAGPPCTQGGQCESQNCTAGFCQGRVPGSPCYKDAQCDSLNCTNHCCQPRTPGALCGVTDQHCDSLNCTSRHCQSRTAGAPCLMDSHCNSLNCTSGRCQARNTGAPCGEKDGHCDSFRCVNGACQ